MIMAGHLLCIQIYTLTGYNSQHTVTCFFQLSQSSKIKTPSGGRKIAETVANAFVVPIVCAGLSLLSSLLPEVVDIINA